MIKILVIDDDAINLDLVKEYLEDDGFSTIVASDGEEGWEALQNNDGISLVLLDRMMPKLDGISFMERVSDNPINIPVIMQTAAADHGSMIQGINSGVYYYLTKPFNQELLLAIVHSALNDGRYKKDLISELKKNQDAISHISKLELKFKTMSEAIVIANFIATAYPDPESVVLGISEILTNAVEHGNLGLGFKEKGDLLVKGQLNSEIERRLLLPENVNKDVTVSLIKNNEEIVLNVKDCGKGFNWHQFMDLEPDRADRPNGRGIMMAKMLSFDSIEYKNNGSEVACTIRGDIQKKSNVA